MSSRSLNTTPISRAELLRMLEGGVSPEQAAALLDYRYVPPLDTAPVEEVQAPSLEALEGSPEQSPATAAAPVTTPPTIPPTALRPARFWLAEQYLPTKPLPPVPKASDLAAAKPTTGEMPVAAPIEPWSSLHPRLRTALSEHRYSRDIDIPQVVKAQCDARVLYRVPLRRRVGWSSRLHLVVDRSMRLTPYWRDQDTVCRALRRIMPPTSLSQAIVDHTVMFDHGHRAAGHYAPAPGEIVLALSDVGLLSAADPTPLVAAWCRWARYWREHHARPVVLFPGQAPQMPGALAHLFTVVPWQRAGAPGDALDEHACVQLLFDLLGSSTRVEPGLLREVRRQHYPDAAIEAKVWQHPRVEKPHSVAATLASAKPSEVQAAFARQRRAARAHAIESIARWHEHLPAEILAEELVALEASNGDLIDATALHRARSTLLALSAKALAGEGEEEWEQAVRRWFDEVSKRLPQQVFDDEELGIALQRMDRYLHRHDDDYQPAYALDPRIEDPQGREPLQHYRLELRDDHVVLKAGTGEGSERTSSLGILAARGSRLRVEREPYFWQGEPPAWAWDWGWDEFETPWVTVAIHRAGDEVRAIAGRAELPPDAVLQTLRWLSPGKFMMGSPDHEPGRYGWEGPQHKVTLTRGFWLFDTPVTQALWTLIMGENPSRFPSSERPVEQVSWDDCQRFLDRLNEAVAGLDLSLPSEAQWEYACRANTDTALWNGPIEIVGESHAPSLDPIAWYGGNSGVGFELGDLGLPTAEDEWPAPNEWPEKQYSFDRAGSREVRGKRASPWGLFDMLGNVLEWCADYWADGYSEAEDTDPAGPSAGDHRVIRGGSWILIARYVRCAYRLWNHPSNRYGILGFRCARVHPGAEPRPKPANAKERRPERTAEQSRRRAVTTADTHQPVDLHQAPQFAFGEGQLLRVRSSEADLTLRPIARPDWSSAFGRDRYGLWAEFTLQKTQDAIELVFDANAALRPNPKRVVQRLRWIPPGTFLMGSPENELGRRQNELQHPVTLTRGFWLFDTPVTQAMWSAVMLGNPARFKSPHRPVESVSWEDCQQFLERLNGATGLGLVLPTEAQWEHACRGGTRTAVYTGAIDILGINNAPALDPIAWYGGNSGVNFDLDKGHSAGWGEKQYEFDRAGTREVKGKRANPWGLYDMLGNVLEWCADRDGDYPVDNALDPAGPRAGVHRVIRGGSWFGSARSVRCAYRNGSLPSYRYGSLGFRCARVQV